MFEPIQGVVGILGEKGRSILTGNNAIEWAIFILCFLALGEFPKLVLRRNIGKKTFNIYLLFASCVFLSTWVLWFCIAYAVFCVSNFQSFAFLPRSTFNGFLSLLIPIVVFGYFVFKATYLLTKLILGAIYNGMNEYYRAAAENSQDFNVLEYRGESKITREMLQMGWSQKQIWYIVEPKAFIRMSWGKLLNPLIAIPLLLSGYSFMLREWYSVYYKEKRERESYLDMKNEMQRSTQHFNQGPSSESATHRITVD